MSQQLRRDAVAYCVALVAIGIFTAFIVRDHRFHDPLSWDEWLTVESYTWVGVTETGDQRPIHRAADFEGLPAPSLRNLALGFYCALGRWPEPNNHVVHSALVNVALAARRSNAMARTPALIGALLFGLLMFHLCWSALGWRAGAFAVLILALGWPYTIDYAASARGYTWGLALLAGWLALTVRAARRPGSIVIGAAMAAVAIASFANIVSSAVLWIAPAYAALLLVKPGDSDGNGREWRRNLVIQLLAIGAVGLVFLIDRLPAVFSSTQQYGSGAASLRDSFAAVGGLLTYLFPAPTWAAIATVGTIAVTAATVRPRVRWLGALAITIAAVDCAYLFQTSRLPYPRVMFHLIPLVLLGVGYATSRFARLREERATWAGGIAVIVALSAVLLAQPVHAAYEERMRELVQAIPSNPAPTDRVTYPVFGPGIDIPALAHQLPSGWLDADMRVPSGAALQLAVFIRQTGDWKLETSARAGAPHAWHPAAWVMPNVSRPADAAIYRLVVIPGQTQVWPAPPGGSVRRVVFWYPDPDRLEASPSNAVATIADAGVRYLEIQKRRVTKVNLYGFLYAVAAITESAQEVASTDQAVGQAIAKFGGNAVVFTPE